MNANRSRSRAATPLLAVTLVLAVAACAAPERDRDQREAPINETRRTTGMTFEQVKTIMDRHAPALMERDGVVGVSIGALEDGAFVIQVMVREANGALLDSIPDVIEGVPVRVEVTGEIRPLGE